MLNKLQELTQLRTLILNAVKEFEKAIETLSNSLSQEKSTTSGSSTSPVTNVAFSTSPTQSIYPSSSTSKPIPPSSSTSKPILSSSSTNKPIPPSSSTSKSIPPTSSTSKLIPPSSSTSKSIPPSSSTSTPKPSAGGGLPQEARDAVVKCHNDFRSQVARGQGKNKDGSALPSGKNVYELKYDPTLQPVVQAIADKCLFKHSGTSGRGENIYLNSGILSPVDAVIASCKRWWTEIDRAGINKDLHLIEQGFESIGHWTQMMWAKSWGIACAIGANCGKTLVFCQYVRQGNVLNQYIYEPGPACQAAADCTTYGNSTCDSGAGLCQKTTN